MSKLATALIITSIMLVGCGSSSDAPALGKVSGSVTIDGKPTENVIVTFTPAEGGRPSSGTTDSGGNFTLSYSSSEVGAVVGMHNVTIAGLVLDFDESTPGYDPEAAAAPNPVPEEYSTMSKEVSIYTGKNTVDLTYP